MNLSAIRMKLAAFFALVTLLVVGAFAIFAARSGVRGIYESAEREAEQHISEVTITTDEEIEFSNTWIVDPEAEWNDPLGPFDVEPPLFRLGERALGNDTYFERFDQDGPWLAHARAVNETQAIVTALPLDEFDADATALRQRLGLGALAAIVLVSGAGYWITGRALEPAAVAMGQQQDFIADAAHELRTPLAVIQASASHALSKPREADAYRESLVEVKAAAERASDGVSELLEFARLQSGQDPLRRAPLRLDLLLEEVAAGVRVDSASIAVVGDEPVVVEADYNLLRQVVENLVRNAASRAGSVVLHASAAAGTATIEVRDDGPGFDEALLPHVFERFRRGDRQGSAGLGLAIARTIVEAHDGHCEAENLEGGGAVVRVVLPRG